jgi:hypothetical protein
MNRRPLRDVTQDQIEAYRRDGAVHIPGVLDRDWVDRLLKAWRRQQEAMARGVPIYQLPQAYLDRDPQLREEVAYLNDADATKDGDPLGITRCKYMHLWDDDFRALVFESPVAEMVGRVIQSNSVRFYWDQIFAKVPGGGPTYWHTDYPGWPVRGNHLPSFWIALTPIRRNLNSLEYIAGTHLTETLPWPRTWNAKRVPRPADRPDFIDWEAHRGDPKIRFLSWDMEPGDAVVIHPKVYHGGGANLHPTEHRIALTTRWFGDDIVWDPRPEAVNSPGMPLSSMVPGAQPSDDAVFPLIWQRDHDRVREAV